MNPDHQQAQITRYDFKSIWHWIATSSSVSSKERPSVQHSLVLKYTTVFQLFDDLHSVLIIIKIFMVWSLSYSAWNVIVDESFLFIHTHRDSTCKVLNKSIQMKICHFTPTPPSPHPILSLAVLSPLCCFIAPVTFT